MMVLNDKTLGETILRRTLDSVVERIIQTDKVDIVDAAEVMGVWLQLLASIQEKGELSDRISRCVSELVIDLVKDRK